MVNYYGKLSDAFSTILTLLYYLLHNDAKCKQGIALEAFKGLMPAQLPFYYGTDNEIALSCDASSHGVNAMLSHKTVQKNPLVRVSMDTPL